MLTLFRFGNFIGEPEESDVEEDVTDDANRYLYDDDESDEDAAATAVANDQQLMEIDGEQSRPPVPAPASPSMQLH